MTWALDSIFPLIMAGLTSVGIYVLGVKGLRLSGYGLWSALGKACECVGLTLVFLLLNLAVGIIAILAARVYMGGFVSLYYLSDATLLVLSSLQALTFQAWRAGSQRGRSPDARDHNLFRREP
jgi:hypothetical protein